VNSKPIRQHHQQKASEFSKRNMQAASSLIILGDGSVGKSSIVNAFKTDGFESVYKQTVGFDVYERTLTLRGDAIISLRVFDIGGQSIHSKSLEQYVSSANVVFLVYDVTNRESFENVSDWLSMFRKYSNSKSNIIVYLVGNKIDMIGHRQVDAPRHNEFIVSNALNGGAFMSAKTGENVTKLFYKAAGESIGISLSPQDLAHHDKVLQANILTGNDNEERTTFADQIEEEDRLAEEAKRKRELQGDGACYCIVC